MKRPAQEDERKKMKRLQGCKVVRSAGLKGCRVAGLQGFVL